MANRLEESIMRYVSDANRDAIAEAWKDNTGYHIALNEGYKASRSTIGDRSICEKTVEQIRYQLGGITLVENTAENNAVRDLRSLVGMTQAEFAAFFDIPHKNIENWEQGRTKPPDYLVRLMKYRLCKEVINCENPKVTVLVLEAIKDALQTTTLGYGILAVEGGCMSFFSQKRRCYSSGNKAAVMSIDKDNKTVTLKGQNGNIWNTFILTFEEFNLASGKWTDTHYEKRRKHK